MIGFNALVSTLAAAAVAGCGSGVEALDPAAALAPVIWPINASVTPSRLSSTFGPRIQIATGKYDFHRGIDIAVSVGTQVNAIAAGTVRIAGADQGYSGELLVQLAHCDDAEAPPSQDDCQAPFYSNYQHLRAVYVKPGTRVRKGQIIARSGTSPSGYPHLHFEIRQGSSWQRSSVHPLAYLPYQDTEPPLATVDDIDSTDPAAPIVTLTVVRPAAELDVVGVEVELVASADGAVLSSQSYDMNEWNYQYTELDDSTRALDNSGLNGITVIPEPFDRNMDIQTIRYRFRRLTSDRAAGEVMVVARVITALGHSSQVTCSLKDCQATAELAR